MIHRVPVVVALVVLSGCGSNLCERSTKANAQIKGDCPAETVSPLLGAMCTANLNSCSAADQKLLESTLGCIEKLPVCLSITKDAWKLQSETCTAELTILSHPYLNTFFQGEPPGFDAGVPDAGPRPILDGGNGVSLIGTANENTIALAWELRRTAAIEKWILIQTDAVGENKFETELTPGGSINLLIPDSGMSGRRFYLAGTNANGDVLTGTAIQMMVSDAGAMCSGLNDCPSDRVCDLGQCVRQTCISGMANTCPNSYSCFAPGECRRTGADGGVFNPGGGTRDAGTQPLQMISNEIGLTPRPPMPMGGVSVGQVPGRRPDIAAFDTARVALALEQEGQLIAHPSTERGADLENEAVTSVGLDTTGSRVHLAWEPTSRALYACYVVGTGIRVQKSADRGRAWGLVANTFLPPLADDGGTGDLYRDCDIAPWKNGGAIMVTAENEALIVRELDSSLAVTQRSVAFTSQPPTDAGVGGIGAPSHPAIATHVGNSLVHVTFTGTRLISGGVGDTEPYGIVRDNAASFGAPTRMTSAVQASPFPEDWTTVAIHPKTGQAVGAFTTLIGTSTQFSTVFVSLYSSQARLWSTGSHLNVLVTDPNISTLTVLFPTRPSTETWFAFSPSIAPIADKDNTFAMSFVAGPRTSSGIGDYRQYLVPFDLARTPAITAGIGWFVPPVQKVSDVRALDPRGSLGAPQPPVSSLAGDSQISVYGVFVQGAGAAGDTEAAAQFFHWP
jgi:hypothetical protein